MGYPVFEPAAQSRVGKWWGLSAATSVCTMQSQTEPRLRITVRLAHALNRLMTWGMPSEDRRPILSESLADWEAMAEEQTWRQMLWRALRGIPSAIWMRLNQRDVTSMPAGIALSLVGFGGVAAGLQSSAYPLGFRRNVIITALGLLLVGVNFVRDPRRILLPRYRIAGFLAAIGFGGLAVTLPTAAQWPYDGPVLENAVMDRAMQVSFLVLAVGFAFIVAASFLRGRSRLVSIGGFLLVVGVAVLGVTQLSWAFGMTPIDLTTALASIVIGLGALSFVHVLPRLRHMEVVGRQPKNAQSGHSKGVSP